MTCGVYVICCTPSGKCYVGSSHNMELRWRQHFNQLLNARHPNRHLQLAWNKYGSSAFKFETLDICSEEILCKRETFHIERLDTFATGFNKTPIASVGPIHDATQRAASSKRMTAYNIANPGFKTAEQKRRAADRCRRGELNTPSQRLKASERMKQLNRGVIKSC